MTGVFIPSKLLNCTVSGQSWKAGGPERALESKEPLHQGALRAIVGKLLFFNLFILSLSYQVYDIKVGFDSNSFLLRLFQ